jgi:RimJ/RimL family protein N-acetyltransferase
MTMMKAQATTDDRPQPVRIDGTRWVSIRPIDRADAPGLSDFYAMLSTESRRLRFLSRGPVPAAITAKLADAPGLVGVLYEPGPRDGAIVAHASIHPDSGGCAEVAFAVADELQGRGLGASLVRRVLAEARQLGMTRVSATMAAENAPMRHLLRDAGPPVLRDRLDAATEEIVLELAA